MEKGWDKNFRENDLSNFFSVKTGIPYAQASRKEKEEVWATFGPEDMEFFIYEKAK